MTSTSAAEYRFQADGKTVGPVRYHTGLIAATLHLATPGRDVQHPCRCWCSEKQRIQHGMDAKSLQMDRLETCMYKVATGPYVLHLTIRHGQEVSRYTPQGSISNP